MRLLICEMIKNLNREIQGEEVPDCVKKKIDEAINTGQLIAVAVKNQYGELIKFKTPEAYINNNPGCAIVTVPPKSKVSIPVKYPHEYTTTPLVTTKIIDHYCYACADKVDTKTCVIDVCNKHKTKSRTVLVTWNVWKHPLHVKGINTPLTYKLTTEETWTADNIRMLAIADWAELTEIAIDKKLWAWYPKPPAVTEIVYRPHKEELDPDDYWDCYNNRADGISIIGEDVFEPQKEIMKKILDQDWTDSEPCIDTDIVDEDWEV